ncbi:MAG: 4'-phosphopantetheinyl transferase superfamily protein [Nitrospiraceae bacterium]|nr:4'-phosphopantetheinyl transferase superfamily protein [Nitrospiraceae bacterium]
MPNAATQYLLDWKEPPAGLTLAANEIHIWRAQLAVSMKSAPLDALTRDERARAQRLRTPEDANRFATARAILRALLGQYLQQDPATIRLVYGQQGKPSLAPGQDAPTLHFNLSRCKDLVLYAFSREHEVGIDIERGRPRQDHLALAKRFFAPEEYLAIHRLPPAERPKAFLLCWTRKEAYVKARGDSLSRSLRKFSVTVDPGLPPEPVADGPRQWSFIDLPAPPGHAAALAIEGDAIRPRCFDW